MPRSPRTRPSVVLPYNSILDGHSTTTDNNEFDDDDDTTTMDLLSLVDDDDEHETTRDIHSDILQLRRRVDQQLQHLTQPISSNHSTSISLVPGATSASVMSMSESSSRILGMATSSSHAATSTSTAALAAATTTSSSTQNRLYATPSSITVAAANLSWQQVQERVRGRTLKDNADPVLSRRQAMATPKKRDHRRIVAFGKNRHRTQQRHFPSFNPSIAEEEYEEEEDSARCQAEPPEDDEEEDVDSARCQAEEDVDSARCQAEPPSNDEDSTRCQAELDEEREDGDSSTRGQAAPEEYYENEEYEFDRRKQRANAVDPDSLQSTSRNSNSQHQQQQKQVEGRKLQPLCSSSSGSHKGEKVPCMNLNKQNKTQQEDVDPLMEYLLATANEQHNQLQQNTPLLPDAPDDAPLLSNRPDPQDGTDNKRKLLAARPHSAPISAQDADDQPVLTTSSSLSSKCFEHVRQLQHVNPTQQTSYVAPCDKDDSKVEFVRVRTIRDPYGDQGQYTGSLLHGKPHGQGTMRYDDGRCYSGQWKYARWHGHGRALFANGDLYVGEYDMDQRHGIGRYEWQDGRVYDGGFYRDQRQGAGSYTWPDGAVYTGDFYMGLRHGYGTYRFKDGSVYVGEWQSGKYHGVGECVWADGRCYRGEWEKGRAHGYGVEIRPDGTVRHDGEWKNDRPLRKKKSK